MSISLCQNPDECMSDADCSASDHSEGQTDCELSREGAMGRGLWDGARLAVADESQFYSRNC